MCMTVRCEKNSSQIYGSVMDCFQNLLMNRAVLERRLADVVLQVSTAILNMEHSILYETEFFKYWDRYFHLNKD